MRERPSSAIMDLAADTVSATSLATTFAIDPSVVYRAPQEIDGLFADIATIRSCLHGFPLQLVEVDKFDTRNTSTARRQPVDDRHPHDGEPPAHNFGRDGRAERRYDLPFPAHPVHPGGAPFPGVRRVNITPAVGYRYLSQRQRPRVAPAGCRSTARVPPNKPRRRDTTTPKVR